MAQPDPSLPYHSFLLRAWQEQRAHPHLPVVWRFILIDTRTGTRHGFATLATLLVFLEEQLRDSSCPDDTDFPDDPDAIERK